MWIRPAGKKPFFFQARQCFLFHVALPRNGLCPGGWGVSPTTPKFRSGTTAPLPPHHGATCRRQQMPLSQSCLNVRPLCPPPGQARDSSHAGAWPISLTLCPRGPEQSLVQSRPSQSTDGMKPRSHAGRTEPS